MFYLPLAQVYSSTLESFAATYNTIGAADDEFVPASGKASFVAQVAQVWSSHFAHLVAALHHDSVTLLKAEHHMSIIHFNSSLKSIRQLP